MSFFLLIVDPNELGDPAIQRFEDGDEALARFTGTERRLRDTGSDQHAVLLIADGEDTLRRTHPHYFASSLGDLLEPLKS